MKRLFSLLLLTASLGVAAPLSAQDAPEPDSIDLDAPEDFIILSVDDCYLEPLPFPLRGSIRMCRISPFAPYEPQEVVSD